VSDRLTKCDLTLEELAQTLIQTEQKMQRLDQEKKKAAAAKKFKEASKA
jgi:hypothetical protein